MIPEKIGIYQIKSELGRGGMATVYLAYDPRFEREVAVKVLPREMLHDPQFRVRFEREAKTIAKLEHSGIVPVYDVGEEDGQPYFVMRYMTGGTLSDRLVKGPMSIQDAAHLIDRVASALDEAHAKGFIHRDLKPGNILFDRAGEPYISDFGIAKFSASQTNVTGSAIVGTPAYLSPEQAQGDANIDGRSDIYAVGVILFEMLSGRQPYEADTPMGVVVKQITDPVPHILDINPNLPEEIEQIIEKAMAKNRDERFSTTREMANALDAVARGGTAQESGKTIIAAAGSTKIQPAKTRIGAKPVVPAAAPVETRGKKSSFTWIIVGVLVLCVVVSGGIGGGIYLTRGNPLDPFVGTTLEPTATERGLQASTTEPPVSPTTGGGVLNPTPETTVKPTDTLAPTPPPVVIGGGADKVAFLQDDNIWVMNLDGTELTQLTTDGAEKTNLQWLPDGRTILYIMGKAIKTVDMETTTEEIITSFNSAEYLDAFQVSRDGKMVAISMNRELYVLPYDVETLAAVTKKSELLKIIEDKGCLFYNDQAIEDVRWSSDGKEIAFIFLRPEGGVRKDTIRVLDISRCSSGTPDRLDDFPGARFEFSNDIANFDWDGDKLFFFNSNYRNDGFGNLIFYNMETHKYERMAPLTGCCYRDATWSPDGSYVAFAFQDSGLGAKSPILLYYVPFATMTTGGSLEPIEGDLTPGFFTDLKEAPWLALRPAQP